MVGIDSKVHFFFPTKFFFFQTNNYFSGLIGNLTLNIAVIKTWIPVNILFIVMLTTGSYS